MQRYADSALKGERILNYFPVYGYMAINQLRKSRDTYTVPELSPIISLCKVIIIKRYAEQFRKSLQFILVKTPYGEKVV